MFNANAILDFWFQGHEDADLARRRAEWFRKSAAFDAAIRRQFGEQWQAAHAGKLAPVLHGAREVLAWIILTDQFPRNMFRDSADAFATDSLAKAAARQALIPRWDLQLPVPARGFVYLPFEHSEALADQQESLALFQDMGDANMLDYAQRHHVLIKRFGRFPHRNAVLGRVSTPQELEHLALPGAGF